MKFVNVTLIANCVAQYEQDVEEFLRRTAALPGANSSNVPSELTIASISQSRDHK